MGSFVPRVIEDYGRGRDRAARFRQSGFTIVEIAVVLVIIGLLVGTFLKAWEMQVSARVRALAETSQGAMAAYYAFRDRYRRVPGDWNSAAASGAIGAPIAGGGNDNGRLDNPPGPGVYNEVNGLWEQMAKAGIINGSYAGTPNTEPTTSNSLAPTNVYNSVVIIGRSSDYEGGVAVRRHVVTGRGLPAGVARELDVKIDDARPDTGAVRATLADGDLTVFTRANDWGGREAACVYTPVAGPGPSKGPPPPPAGPPRWNAGGAQDCNAVILF